MTNSCTTPGDETKLIMAMHPHGIVPFHALLWAAYCDQHYVYEDKKLYGFGAAADVVAYLPFLRNIMVCSMHYSTSMMCMGSCLSMNYLNRVGWLLVLRSTRL